MKIEVDHGSIEIPNFGLYEFDFTTSGGPPQLVGTTGKNLSSPLGRKTMNNALGWKKRSAQ